MTEDEVLAVIDAIARERLDGAAGLGPDTRLVEDLELDSLRLLTLVIAVEDRFRICLEEEDEARIRTVGDLVKTVRSKLGVA